jgi:hypothetical protein
MEFPAGAGGVNRSVKERLSKKCKARPAPSGGKDTEKKREGFSLSGAPEKIAEADSTSVFPGTFPSPSNTKIFAGQV